MTILLPNLTSLVSGTYTSISVIFYVQFEVFGKNALFLVSLMSAVYIRKFPNVICAIDGCLIRIAQKAHERVSYFNFKCFHSIQLQAVALFNRCFTDIFVG